MKQSIAHLPPLILVCTLGFTLCACTQIKSSDIPRITEGASPTQTALLERESGRYSELIDVLVAFLWPEKISTQDQRQELTLVLQNSRNIFRKKRIFQLSKIEILTRFAIHHCDCAINQICAGQETDLDPALCYAIEDELYENDRRLVEVYALVEEVRAGVKRLGGEWIDTHLDLPGAPSPQVHFNRSEMSLTAFGSYPLGEKRFPIAYPPFSIAILDGARNLSFSASFPRLVWDGTELSPSGEWRMEGSISKSEFSLLFQGDLVLRTSTGSRHGIIFWENSSSR